MSPWAPGPARPDTAATDWDPCEPVTPEITSVVPDHGEEDSTVAVTIRGRNFAPDAQVAISGAGVVVQNVVWIDATRMTCELVIALGASADARDLTVTNP